MRPKSKPGPWHSLGRPSGCSPAIQLADVPSFCGHAARPVRSRSPASVRTSTLTVSGSMPAAVRRTAPAPPSRRSSCPGSSASSETSPSTEWSSPRLPTVSTTTPGWCGRTGTGGPPVKTWDSRPERSGRSPSNFSPPRPLTRGGLRGRRPRLRVRQGVLRRPQVQVALWGHRDHSTWHHDVHPARHVPRGVHRHQEVDAYIARQNPHRLKVPPTVWSPDLRPGRVTTFGG